MILDIDLGNTRLKWRMNASPDERGKSYAIPVSVIQPDMRLPVASPPERIRIATVRGPAAEMALIQWSKHQFGIAPQFARSTFTAANVSSAYDVPERLGVDRWLAMLAAYNSLSEAVVVIDLGSAMTADGVSKAGHHVGGYIAPGLRMMAQSLLARTDLVRFDGDPEGTLHPAKSTASAVSSGVLAASVGFAEQVWSRLSKECSAKIAVITGGDADLVTPNLSFPFRLEPDLVLDGLALALP